MLIKTSGKFRNFPRNMDSTQMQALKLAESGHNLLITGSPGTGKTYTMGILIETLQMCGRNVNVTASTGKAATVLRQQCKVNVTTIHRFLGLRDGRYNNEELLNLLKHSEVFVRQKENILGCQALIIDEVSMISVQMLEQIEFICRSLKDTTKPFGGIQMIFSGDFFQLPPVPNINYGDDGALMIGSTLLDYFHHINLVNIHRQDEPDLIKAIHEISRGEISKSTEQLFFRLHRSLPPGEDPVRLFATNLDVDICNSESLLKMEGEDKVYVSEDEGDVTNTQGRDRLHLKVGCPVILIVNLSDELVNGLDGIIRELKDKSVVCFFPSLQRQEEIYKYHFKKYSVELRKDIGCRVQLPLKLGFAITVHKAQGMTLDRVSIDCRGMFQYGQLAVAISRATKKKGLQILNFSRNLVRKPPDILRKFYEKTEVSVSEDLSCCVKAQAQTDVPVTPDINLYIQDVGTKIGDEEVDEIDLQSGDEAEFIEMIESVEKDISDKEVKYPLPAELNIESLLMKICHEKLETDQQASENKATVFLKENLLQTTKFVQYLWDEIWPIKEKYFPENVENKMVTEFYQKYNNIVTGEEYRTRVNQLFGQNPSPAQYNIVFKLSTIVRTEMLKFHSQPIMQAAKEKAYTEKGKEFPESSGGRGKIRYLAGWCISRLKKLRIKKLTQNLYKKEKVKCVESWLVEKNLLQHLEANEVELETSRDQESLKETSRRQNVRHGLTNVTDECFDFFLILDRKITTFQTIYNLNLYGSNFFQSLMTELDNDKILHDKWVNLFEAYSEKHTAIIKSLLIEALSKYCMMSVAQLRKDYLKQHEIKKREATRKQIKIKSASVKKNQINMESIQKDCTENKAASHKRLQSELLIEQSFLEQNFKKSDLLILCKMYMVKPKSVQSKQKIADILRPVILEKEIIPSTLPGEQESEPSTSTVVSELVTSASTEMLEEVEESQAKNVSETLQKTVKQTRRQKSLAGKGKSKKNKTEKESESSTSTEVSELVTSANTGMLDIEEDQAKNVPETSQKTVKQTRKRKSLVGKGKSKKKKTGNKWPCGICGKDASIYSVGCDGCDQWFHADCLKIDSLDTLPDEWYCNNCLGED